MKDRTSYRSEVVKCQSCGYGYTTGHGLFNDWFCSERCGDWFDKGWPDYRQQQEIARKSVGYIYPHLEIKRMRKKSEAKKSLESLADCLDCSPRRIKHDVIEGSRGRVRADGDRTTLIADHVSRRKLSSLQKQLAFMQHDGHEFDASKGYSGKWSMSNNPTLGQAAAIRKAVGLKRSTISDSGSI
jgi:hypothetical protein